MSVAEAVLLSDRVLQRVFFDQRRFAPALLPSDAVATVSNLEQDLAEDMVEFLAAKTMPEVEKIQTRMRGRYFLIRRLCDGYLVDLPANFADGCVHITTFERTNADPYFNVDQGRRYANWKRYAGRAPPYSKRLGVR